MKICEITDEEALALYREKQRKRREIKRAIPNPFDTKSTGMPMYDDWLKDTDYAREQKGFDVYVVNISPDEYISACVKGFKSTYESIIRSRTDSGKVEEYAELMKSGETFPMLMVQYSLDGYFTQEGLHRALAAKSLGIDKVPVLVAKELP